MRCPNCGYENPEGATFCNFCGKAIAPATAAPAPPPSFHQPVSPPAPAGRPRHCVSCGRSIPWEANVCPYCGHDYRVPTYSYLQQETISSGLRAVFYILSILIPLAGIIIGIIYYAKPDPESKRVGKNCIIIAVLVWVVVAVLVVVALAVSVAVMNLLQMMAGALSV